VSATPGGARSVILIGVRDAGKSNYLFRLWMAIDAAKGKLRKSFLPDDIEHLRAGSDRLFRGQFAERTAPEMHVRVEIPVRSAFDDQAGLLVVPDVAGEQVLAICRNREWSADWESQISETSSCLILVRADSSEIISPLDWVAYQEMFGEVPSSKPIDTQPSPAGANGTGGADKRREELPTQVVLVEWLQFLRRAFTSLVGGSFRPRIGIAVSAWDAVPADRRQSGPESYIQENFPLLFDFASCQRNRFEFQYFGVSIVNGDLKNDPEFRARYLNGRPNDFGSVAHSLTGPLSESGDITIPIAWALGFIDAKDNA
jgi:hypothetical protein